MRNLSFLFLATIIALGSCKKDDDSSDDDNNNNNNNNNNFSAEFFVEASLDGQSFRVEEDDLGNVVSIYSTGGAIDPSACELDYGSTLASWDQSFESPGFGIHFNKLYNDDCDEQEELAQFTSTMFQHTSYSLVSSSGDPEVWVEFHEVTCDGCSNETDQLTSSNGTNSSASLAITDTETYTNAFGFQRIKVIGTFDNVTVYDDAGNNPKTFTNGTFSLSYAPYYD